MKGDRSVGEGVGSEWEAVREQSIWWILVFEKKIKMQKVPRIDFGRQGERINGDK